MITDYASLQAGDGSIADYLQRSDLTSVIPTFIQLCEAEFRRVIRSRHTTIVPLATTAALGTITLPDGVSDVRELVLDVTSLNNGGSLEIVSMGQLIRERIRHPTTAWPRFANVADRTISLAPIPDAVYSILAEVEAVFLPLSNATTSNWVLASYPDAYLYGSLVHSAPYLKDDNRLALWSELSKKALAQLDEVKERTQYPGTPIQRLKEAYG